MGPVKLSLESASNVPAWHAAAPYCRHYRCYIVMFTSRPARRDLPHGPLWLVRLVPQASAYGSQLQHLLADPEFAALAETVPQMRRLLRPLSRMLGVRLPPPRAVAAPPDIPAPATPAPADPLAPLAPWPRPPDLPPMGLLPVRPAARPPPKPP